MNILSFSYCFPRRTNPTWGVFVSHRLAAMARRVRLEVVAPAPTFPLLSPGNAAGPIADHWEGLTVHRPRFFYVPGFLKSFDPRFYASGINAWFRGAIARRRPALLDAHFIWPDGVAVARLARRHGIPYAITLRGKVYPCLDIPSQKRQCADALRGAAAVISVDQRMAQLACELGADPARVHVIANGVDIRRFTPDNRTAARRELELPTDARLLVSVGHLGVRKGHRETIHAIAKLPDDVRLVLVGGDSTSHRGGRRELETLADELGVRDRVLFTGKQPYDKIPRYFQAADASVLASWREGCPNVVLESLACGTPVIATDVGSTPMMIEDGRNGRITPPRDAERLTESIRYVLERDMPPEQVRSSPIVRSWDDVAADVVDVFTGVLDRPTRAVS